MFTLSSVVLAELTARAAAASSVLLVAAALVVVVTVIGAGAEAIAPVGATETEVVVEDDEVDERTRHIEPLALRRISPVVGFRLLSCAPTPAAIF